MKTATKWALTIAAALLVAVVTHGQQACHPSQAAYTELVYVPAGDNTAVKLRVWCEQYDGTLEPSLWYVSFFHGRSDEGAQPDLWDWWGIQNIASMLLRGD